MKTPAIMVNGIEDIGFGAVTLAELGPNDVHARAEVSLVSTGTETRIIRHGYPNTEFPIVPGYSAVGTVQRVGHDVKHFTEGDHVFLTGGNRLAKGVQSLWGAHCLDHTVSADSMVKLRADCASEQAAFTNVIAIALHGVEFAGIEPNERVLVIGLGLIGQCSVRCLLARGARVIACDIDAGRRALAEAVGASSIDPATGDLAEQIATQWGEGPDAVFEVSGRADMVGVAARLLGARAWEGPGRSPRLVLQANYTESFSIGARDLFQREATVLSPRANTKTDREAAAQMIATGAVNLNNLLPHRTSPRNAPAVYDNLMTAPGSQVTALFDWSLDLC